MSFARSDCLMEKTTKGVPRLAAPERSGTTGVRALRPPLEPSTIVLVVRGSIARADIPVLCERARVLVKCSGAELVVCDVSALLDPDATVVEALARLQLTARRLGHQIQLLHACDALLELLTLTGLRDVFPLCAELSLEPGRQAEERKQGRGVEEETDPGDSPA
jgi:ABC-type transporter Mla MlaB component